MNIEWTYVEIILWVEMLICIPLIVPSITTEMWRQILSYPTVKKLRVLGDRRNFTLFVVILVAIFVDAARDWRTSSANCAAYNPFKQDQAANIATQMKLYRAQRNFYVTGICFFMIFVIKRLITLVALKASDPEKTARLVPTQDGSQTDQA